MNHLRKIDNEPNLSKGAVDEITKVLTNMKKLHDIVITHLNENKDGFVVAGRKLKIEEVFEDHFSDMLKQIVGTAYKEVEHLVDRSDREFLDKVKNCL